MANSPKEVFESFVKRGSTDREAMFKMIEHYNELHWKNDAQLRGDIDMLKKRVKVLEAGKS